MALLSLLYFIFGPLVLIYVLINQPKSATVIIPLAYRPRLIPWLGTVGLLLFPVAGTLPSLVLLAVYLWAFIAEYIYVSKGHSPRLMLIFSAFVFTGRFAVLIAWLTPRKRAVQLP